MSRMVGKICVRCSSRYVSFGNNCNYNKILILVDNETFDLYLSMLEITGNNVVTENNSEFDELGLNFASAADGSKDEFDALKFLD